ncbi:type VI secretion protein VasK, partial [Pantoea sp. SM3]
MTGYAIFVVALECVSAFLIYTLRRNIDALGVSRESVWVIWGCSIIFLMMAVFIFYLYQKRLCNEGQKPYKPEQVLENDSPLQQTKSTSVQNHNILLEHLRQVLRTQYGHFWKRKIRILLITGSVADVERLTPGLPEQLWQEDSGTLLLWGGDTASYSDQNWLIALKRLRRRPADALVWVTSAADRLAVVNGSPPAELPSAAAIDATVHELAAHYKALGWRLPLFVWSLHLRAGEQPGRQTQAVGCMMPDAGNAVALCAELAEKLITQGIQQAAGSSEHRFLLSLADQLVREPGSLTALLTPLHNPFRPLPLAGMVFSTPSAGAQHSMPHHWGWDNRWDAIPASLKHLPSHLRAVRPGLSWAVVLAAVSYALVVLWGAGMLVSFLANRSVIDEVQAQTEQVVDARQPLPQRLASLAVLQKTIERLQYRVEHAEPWYSRLGLNQNEALLTALWPRYGEAALPLLRDAAAEHLLGRLNTFAALAPDSPLRETQSKQAYTQLRLYLMLTRPERMDPSWFSQSLMQNWVQRQGLDNAYWQGAGSPLLAFYAENLISHPEWALKADPELVRQVRTLLVRQMGVTNSESRQYQRVLSQVARQYADMRLADMTGDTDAGRLFTTDEVVPGMFTRQAWEDGVKPAIEKVARERREEMDWVLSDAPPPAGDASSPEALEARLTSRYFSDYSAAWLNFLNSLRLQPAPTLSDAID